MNEYKNIIVQPLASSTQENRFLLSYNGNYFEANHSIVELLNLLQESSTKEEAISSYIQKKKGKYTFQQIEKVINNIITPLFSASSPKHSFLYEKQLFRANIIDKYSDILRFLFNNIYMSTILVITIILDLFFFFTTDDLILFNNNANIYIVVGLLAFTLFSSFFHELGHASACKFFGIQHGGIGFGLYLNFPVLYTDVTEVWKLNRKQRCIVNIAGIYFQCYWLIGLLISYIFTQNDFIRYLILTMNFGFLLTLNPFFKFDGYWIASDILGVPNLRTRSLELLKYWYKQLRKQPINRIPYLLQIQPIAKYGLLAYSIILNIFIGGYFFYIIPAFLLHFVKSFPDTVNELIFYLSNGMSPSFALLCNIGSQLLFLVLIGYLFWKLVQPLVKRYVTK